MRLFPIVTALAAGVLVLGCTTSQDDSDLTASTTATATSTAALAAAASPSATPTAPAVSTVEPSPVPEVSPTPMEVALVLPDRTDCEEVRGTDYRSENERSWFLATCVAPPTPAPPTSAVPAAESPVAPAPAAPVANQRVAIQEVTSPVMRGTTATFKGTAPPGERCALMYPVRLISATDNPALAQLTGATGFVERQMLTSLTADASGVFTWSWTIDPASSPGLASLTLICDGRRLAAPIVIQAPE